MSPTKLFIRRLSTNRTITTKKFILEKYFKGTPKETDLKLVEETLPPIKDGEFLTEAVYLSVDPYMRAYVPRVRLGSTLIGSQVARILESKNPKYPTGRYVVGDFGWRLHTVANVRQTTNLLAPWLIPDPPVLPLSLYLGVLGMPGNTAYFGLLEICRPKPGETVAITGAAGAVGSIVGQIAKIKGCKVIGIAGSDVKGKWLVDDLKFDHFINYKDPDFKVKLKQATTASDGVDCYFDNVGGEISSLILNRMNPFGRIGVCGAISAYNDPSAALASNVQTPIVFNQLKMEGFVVSRWLNRWHEGISQLQQWINEDKIVYRETVTEGFENMFSAFINMLDGGNIGKAIVKV